MTGLLCKRESMSEYRKKYDVDSFHPSYYILMVSREETTRSLECASACCLPNKLLKI